MKVTILDGYVDEPTCLGVPPYISPYPRYIAGAIWCFDKKASIFYFTIDQVRKDNSLLNNSDLLIVIAGVCVPGRYFSGFPVSPNELTLLLKDIDKPVKVLTGPAARYGFGISGGKKTREIGKEIFDIIAKGDGEIVISDLLKNNLKDADPSLTRNSEGVREFAIKGSKIVKQHPFFPNYLICEIETYRGCPRNIVGGCSFCSERGSPDFRQEEDIVKEVEALYNIGVKHFRIGNQPCIFSYMSSGREEFPRPNPEALERLFKGIRSAAPNLKTLHIDNANPGEIARYPLECKKIAKTIIRYHTPGDVAAFGMESADPVVIKRNNLKASPEEVEFAIELLNSVGSKRGYNGLPELLPGLNFVSGLIGETRNTFELNYNFLKRIYDRGLLLRRINLRQVIPIPGTKMFAFGDRNIKKHKSNFQSFKRKVREEIEKPMLKRLLPLGTVLRGVFTEAYKGKLTFGRQLGSYPILVGIPGIHPLNTFINIKVVDYGYRSVTGVPYPLDINNAPRKAIEAIPGIGKKRSARIIAKRPFRNKEELEKALDDRATGKKLLEYIKKINL